MTSYDRIYLLLVENETVEEGIKTKLLGLGLAAVAGLGGAKATRTPEPNPAPKISVEKAGDALGKPMFNQAQKDRIDKAIEQRRKTREVWKRKGKKK